MYFSFFTFFSVSSHILGPTVCVSHFERFSLFLAIFQVLPSEFLIFLLCQCFFFFHHIPGLIVFVSHFPRFSVFSPSSRSCIVYLSFSTFLSVSCHIPGQTVFVSHFPHFSVLAIFQFLQCALLIFHVFQ